MAAAELTSALIDVFARVFDLAHDAVSPDMTPDQVAQWDSLGHVRLIADIEETFQCQLDIDDVMALTSFGAALQVLEKRARAGA